VPLPVEAVPSTVPLELPPSWNVTVVPEGAGEAVRKTVCPWVEGFGLDVRVKLPFCPKANPAERHSSASAGMRRSLIARLL
jgi:hypothetical protein